MNKIHILYSGPIRPDNDYIFELNDKIHNMLSKYKIITHLCYWKLDDTQNENFKIKCNQKFSYVYDENEPNDEYIYINITARTKQQRNLKTIEHWTPRIYKMFYGIRLLVNNSDKYIDDGDIVIRVRTDLYIKNYNNIDLLIENLINKKEDYFFIRSRVTGNNSCDWFSISKYNIFKKIYYIQNDKNYNNIINNVFNAENTIIYNCYINKINIVNIKKFIDLAILRKNRRIHEYN